MVEALARFVFQQLVLAVEFCHRKGKVLRDINLGSTLLGICNGQLPLLKLCDFSISRDVVRDSNFYSQVRLGFSVFLYCRISTVSNVPCLSAHHAETLEPRLEPTLCCAVPC